ncbi:unnamed protein product [Acanthosepion pharaonis]|uniref:Uncharacterized protein n=1 Tax=Acanthosepion pharaonis TaxID=158019 RepID=A0A812BXD0_ACAPH|nr:unnamed protein product [Sepia pharaonis]
MVIKRGVLASLRLLVVLRFPGRRVSTARVYVRLAERGIEKKVTDRIHRKLSRVLIFINLHSFNHFFSFSARLSFLTSAILHPLSILLLSSFISHLYSSLCFSFFFFPHIFLGPFSLISSPLSLTSLSYSLINVRRRLFDFLFHLFSFFSFSFLFYIIISGLFSIFISSYPLLRPSPFYSMYFNYNLLFISLVSNSLLLLNFLAYSYYVFLSLTSPISPFISHLFYAFQVCSSLDLIPSRSFIYLPSLFPTISFSFFYCLHHCHH